MNAIFKQVEVFPFSGLNEKVQKKLIEKEKESRWDFFDSCESDFIKESLEILGFSEIKILYNISFCQGDGASFEGKGELSKESINKFVLSELFKCRDIEHLKEPLQKINDILEKENSVMYLKISQCRYSRYIHENSMNYEILFDESTGEEDYSEYEEIVKSLFKQLAKFTYSQISRELLDFLNENFIKESLMETGNFYLSDGTNLESL